MAEYADIIQIGARNAQNFQLLIAAARTGKPILLKRGLSMKIEEWLLAGEYVLANENANLMFCERGIRTFETYTRNTLDLSTIPIIKQESHCPIVIDPSQGAGPRRPGEGAVQRRGGHGRRRLAHRGASEPGGGLERRRAAGVPGDLRATDAGVAPAHRRGGEGVRPGQRAVPRQGSSRWLCYAEIHNCACIPRRGTFRMASRHRDTWSGGRTIMSSWRKTNLSTAVSPRGPT